MVAASNALSIAYSDRLTIKTSSGTTTLQSRAQATVAGSTADGQSFGVAVVVDLTAIGQQAVSGTLQKLIDAITTLQRSEQQTLQFQKNAAGQKLALALQEVAFLKLLGGGLAGAREAVRIAKEIKAAVADYQAAAASGCASDETAADPSISTDTAAAADIADTTDTAASPSAAPDIAPAAPAAPEAGALAAPDPFITAANEGLSALRKYLDQTLPPLKAAKDRHTSSAAAALERQFDQIDDASFGAIQSVAGSVGGLVGLVA